MIRVSKNPWFTIWQVLPEGEIGILRHAAREEEHATNKSE
jgi:hypothetical protein